MEGEGTEIPLLSKDYVKFKFDKTKSSHVFFEMNEEILEGKFYFCYSNIILVIIHYLIYDNLPIQLYTVILKKLRFSFF